MVQPKSLTAIMGPSGTSVRPRSLGPPRAPQPVADPDPPCQSPLLGCGKSTLLDILADRKAGTPATGQILINGQARYGRPKPSRERAEWRRA